MRLLLFFLLIGFCLAEIVPVLIDFSPFINGKLRSRLRGNFAELEGKGETVEEKSRFGRLLNITETILKEQNAIFEAEMERELSKNFGPSKENSTDEVKLRVLVGNDPPPVKEPFSYYSPKQSVGQDLQLGISPERTEKIYSDHLRMSIPTYRLYYRQEISEIARKLSKREIPLSLMNKVVQVLDVHRNLPWLSIKSVSRSGKYGILIEFSG